MAWEQSHKLRCSSNSPTWLAAQHHGAFNKHMQDTFALLAQCAALEYCRFDIPFEQQEYDAGMLIVQDEHADVMGQFAMINASHIVTNTGGWLLHGWPHAAAQALPLEGNDPDPGVFRRMLAQLRADDLFTKPWLRFPTRQP